MKKRTAKSFDILPPFSSPIKACALHLGLPWMLFFTPQALAKIRPQLVCENLLSPRTPTEQSVNIALRWAYDRGWALNALPVAIEQNPLVRAHIETEDLRPDSSNEQKNRTVGAALMRIIERAKQPLSPFQTNAALGVELLPWIGQEITTTSRSPEEGAPGNHTVIHPLNAQLALQNLSAKNKAKWEQIFATLKGNNRALSPDLVSELNSHFARTSLFRVKSFGAGENTGRLPLVNGHTLNQLGLSYEKDFYQSVQAAPNSVGFHLRLRSPATNELLPEHGKIRGATSLRYDPPKPDVVDRFVHPEFGNAFQLFQLAKALSPAFVERWIQSQFLYLSARELTQIHQWEEFEWEAFYPKSSDSNRRLRGLLPALAPLILTEEDFETVIFGMVETYLLVAFSDHRAQRDFIFEFSREPQKLLENSVFPFFGIPAGFRLRVMGGVDPAHLQRHFVIPGGSPRTGLGLSPPSLFPLRDRVRRDPSID